MNYLAHLYLATVPVESSKHQASLSEGTDESLLGSLLGDFVKGDDHALYSEGIRRAILIHRRIDAYSNANPVYRRSKRRIHNRYRHTKAILVDIFYDHFLARDWDMYTDESLDDFTHHVYRILDAHRHILPPRLLTILPWMTADNWLRSYRDLTSVGLALEGLSRRLDCENRLHRGLEELCANYEELGADFQTFFPQLEDYVATLRDGIP